MTCNSNLISELNTASTVHKTVSIGTLKTNTRYRMKDVRSVTTRYGRTVATTLQIEGQDEEVDVYLPQRVSSFLKEDVIQELNTGPPLYLIYLGKVGQCHDVKFEH